MANDHGLEAVTRKRKAAALACGPVGAAVQAVFPGSPAFQTRDVDGAIVGDTVAVATAGIGCER